MWGILLAVLNSYFYYQYLNKAKQIWIPKLRIRAYNSHFPRVLVYTCFVGTSMKIYQNAQSRRRIQAKHIQKPNEIQTPGQNTSTAEAQALPGAHTPKAVARPAAQGAAAPWVLPYHPQLWLAPHFFGGTINAPRGGCMWGFSKIHEQTIILKL